MVAVKIVSDWRRWLQPPSSGATKLRRHLSAKMGGNKNQKWHKKKMLSQEMPCRKIEGFNKVYKKMEDVNLNLKTSTCSQYIYYSGSCKYNQYLLQI